jgi:hypothetical protein
VIFQARTWRAHDTLPPWKPLPLLGQTRLFACVLQTLFCYPNLILLFKPYSVLQTLLLCAGLGSGDDGPGGTDAVCGLTSKWKGCGGQKVANHTSMMDLQQNNALTIPLMLPSPCLLT